MPTYKVQIQAITDHEIVLEAASEYDAEYKAEEMVANHRHPSTSSVKTIITDVQRMASIIDEVDGDTPFFVAVTYETIQSPQGIGYPKVLTCELTVFHDEEHNVEAYRKTVAPCDALTLVDIAYHSNVADYSYDDVASLTHHHNNQQ